MKEKEVFKVVALMNSGKVYKSRNFPTCEHALTYKINEPTTPIFGKIFAFRTVKQAKEHIEETAFGGNDGFAVFKADALGVQPYRYKWFNVFYHNYESLWDINLRKRELRAGRLRRGSQNVPPGTILCDQLTLIERVY